MQTATDINVPVFSMAGIRVDGLRLSDLSVLLERARTLAEPQLILNHNLHSLYLYLTDENFASAYRNASWIYVDGMPVIWMAQLAGFPARPQHRITFLDCFDSILLDAVRYGWSVFYLGSSPEVLDEGLSTLRKRHPQLILAGGDGYFERDGPENERIIARINAFKPDVLFVGMGMPLQEKWIAANVGRLQARSILTSGATLDYVAGRTYCPPAWAGPLGLYGILRMLHDPRRLWRRYLAEPLWLACCLLPHLIHQRLTREAVVPSIGA